MTDKPTAQHKNHDAYFVPGLHRGLLVMETIAQERRRMSVTAIAKKLGLTRSSVFRLTYTLKQMGFLESSPESKEFGLGARVLNIGFAYLASQDIIEVARPHLEALRDETNVSSHLAIRDGHDVLYLDCVQTRSGFFSNLNVGSRLPAHASPLGWLLLSNLSPREIVELYEEQPFDMLSEHTPRDIQALMLRVAEAASKGHVVSRGIVEIGGSSVAAPIHDKSGAVVAALDISGPDSAFDFGTTEHGYTDAVIETARSISRRLGHMPRTSD